jgi:hypothetical protein
MANNPKPSKPLSGTDYRRTLTKISRQIDSALYADGNLDHPLPPNVRAATFSTTAANVRDLILGLTQREADARR